LAQDVADEESKSPRREKKRSRRARKVKRKRREVLMEIVEELPHESGVSEVDQDESEGSEEADSDESESASEHESGDEERFGHSRNQSHAELLI